MDVAGSGTQAQRRAIHGDIPDAAAAICMKRATTGDGSQQCMERTGGGEGRSKGGRHPCSPTGVLAKGGKTRRKNHPTDKFILRRRK